jgi:hypothetical protein
LVGVRGSQVVAGQEAKVDSIQQPLQGARGHVARAASC